MCALAPVCGTNAKHTLAFRRCLGLFAEVKTISVVAIRHTCSRTNQQADPRRGARNPRKQRWHRPLLFAAAATGAATGAAYHPDLRARLYCTYVCDRKELAATHHRFLFCSLAPCVLFRTSQTQSTTTRRRFTMSCGSL